MNRQLALAIQINHEATFHDFCWGENTLLQQQLHRSLEASGDRLLYLWGMAGSGKSHLLQACCQAMGQQYQSAIYLPLHTLKDWGADVIEGLDEQSLICVDDIDAIAKDATWEEAIFHLYNRVRDQEKSLLIISGKVPPAQLAIQLPDLRSRLSWGLVMQLHELNDEDKIKTLQSHAFKRGLKLPNNVVQFLISRCGRNMHDLYALLDKLDEASLIAQRKITIPFVKDILGI